MIKKNNNLLNGKGEHDVQWITVNGAHIPIKDGETKQNAIKKHFAEKEKHTYGVHPNAEITKLIGVLKAIKKVKKRELINQVLNFKPIKLNINGREIVAEFDKYTVGKNLYGRGNSTHKGHIYKLEHVDQIPSLIKTATYHHSSVELGKNSPQHEGVKEWHYFINHIETDKGSFDVLINIRDKGQRQFVYEITFRNKKT